MHVHGFIELPFAQGMLTLTCCPSSGVLCVVASDQAARAQGGNAITSRQAWREICGYIPEKPLILEAPVWRRRARLRVSCAGGAKGHEGLATAVCRGQESQGATSHSKGIANFGIIISLLPCLLEPCRISLFAEPETTTANVALQVPQVKRSLERFVFQIKAFFHEVNNPEAFWMGNLKHRDLAGNCLPSQMYPEEDDAEDEQGEDDVLDDGSGDDDEGNSMK